MNVFEGYTLRNRPEVTLTMEEICEVAHHYDALSGLDSLTCWLENEAPYVDQEDPETQAMIKYAKEHENDLELGSDIWINYMDTCTYDMGYEEMHSVVRCLKEGMDYDS